MTLADSKRLFFALWPDDKLRVQIEDVTRPLRDISSGRPVPSENFHITLEFLGNVAAADFDAVVAAAKDVRFAPMAFTLDRWGCFAKPKVAWLGPSSFPPALTTLVKDLRGVLSPVINLQPERLYTPHVTVLRKQPVLPELPLPRQLVWNADSFVLVESIFGEGRAIYNVLETYSAC